MPAIFSIMGLALNLMGVIVLFRYGMPYRVRTEGDTGSATVLDVEHHNLGLFGLGAPDRNGVSNHRGDCPALVPSHSSAD